MKVLITGATGLIGRALGTELATLGYEIYVLSRQIKLQLPFSFKLIQGDLSQTVIPELKSISFDSVFHLMGESIAQRWTSEVKKRIYDSRIKSTENLILSLGGVKNLISISAIGIYGNRGSERLTEESKLGSDFLAQICQDWESATDKASFQFPGVRIIKLRLGLVLSSHGGAFPKLLMPFKLGLGGALGDGLSYMSWIHLDDLIQMIIFILNNNQLNGVFNAVAPQAILNQEFTKILSHKLHRWSPFKIPKVILKGVLGEMSSALLYSQNVDCSKIQALGFKFNYESLSLALDEILKT